MCCAVHGVYLVVKVKYMHRYQWGIRKTQLISSDVLTKESVKLLDKVYTDRRL